MNWDKIYLKKGRVQKRPLRFINLLYKYLNQNQKLKILDLGCGTGRHSFYLAKNEKWQISAVDSSIWAVKFVKNKIKKNNFENIKIYKANFKKLPFQNKYFDAIVSTNALHHGSYKDIKKYCSEINRILKNNGYLFLSILSDKDFRAKTGKSFKGEINTRINCDNLPDSDLPHHFFNDKEIEECFKKYKIIYKKIKKRIAIIKLKPSVYYDLILKKKL